MKDCALCPRLSDFRRSNQEKFPDYFNGAVPSFGSSSPKLLIVGLAPGLKGANWSGRPFTGDYAGDLLYECLLETGLASGLYDRGESNQLTLPETLITNAVRCVPPQNKPTTAEINQCRPFLQSLISSLHGLQTIMVLGQIAHISTLKALGEKPSAYPFKHAACYKIKNKVAFISSYHCSRYNVNTNRLTRNMFMDVLHLCLKHMQPQAAS